MGFVYPLVGAVLGAVAGQWLGHVLIFNIDGTSIDVRYIVPLLGAVVGYFIGTLFVPKKKKKSDDAS